MLIRETSGGNVGQGCALTSVRHSKRTRSENVRALETFVVKCFRADDVQPESTNFFLKIYRQKKTQTDTQTPCNQLGQAFSFENLSETMAEEDADRYTDGRRYRIDRREILAAETLA